VTARLDLPPEHPHVAVVTIDRPERANSLDPPTLRALAACWRRIADLDAAYRRQEEIGRELRRTEDAAEAARAFAEKRRPAWRGQ